MNRAATAPNAVTRTGYRHRALLWAWATFTVLWFALLAQRPLYDPDEGRYAEIPREMLAGGDWVIPHLDGLVYLEKPPLQYWLTALLFRLFGENEFVARLVTGCAGYCSLGIVMLVGWRLWGYRAGLKAGLLTGASVLFVLMGHQLTLDMLLTLCLLASLGCFLLSEQEHAAARRVTGRTRWMLGCWAAMAFSVLTKGLIGVAIPAATLAAYMTWQQDFSPLRRLHLRWGLPLFLLIALPWFLMAARANPAFLQFFFIREHLQRFLTPIEHRSQPWWFFVPVLIVGVLPWLPQALRALALPLRAAPRRAFAPARVLWAWCAFVLIFFSLSDAKLIPYILPAVPALALLCAAPAGSSPAVDRETRHDLVMGSLLSLVSFIGILVYAGGEWSTAHSRLLAAQLAPLLTMTAALLAAAGSACLLLTWRLRYDAALAVLCVGWFLGSLTLLTAADGAQRFFSSRDAALLLRSAAPASATIFSVQTYEQSLPFYLRRRVVLVDYRDEFALGLSQNSDQGITSLNQFANRWRSLDQGYAIMPNRSWKLLSGQGVPMRSIGRFPHSVVVSRR